jgi:hypothetical protein
MNKTYIGTVTGVAGTHIFLACEEHPAVFAHRDKLAFTDPYIGMRVTFRSGYHRGHAHAAQDVRRVE